jgi:hypothetical protein
LEAAEAVLPYNLPYKSRQLPSPGVAGCRRSLGASLLRPFYAVRRRPEKPFGADYQFDTRKVFAAAGSSGGIDQ